MFERKKSSSAKLSSEKEWFIIIDNRQEGPFSMIDLKREPRFNPDVLVWKKGFKEWLPARKVEELDEVFADEEPSKIIHEPLKGKKLESDLGQEGQATLALHQDPFQIILWILVGLLIILYTFYQFFEK